MHQPFPDGNTAKPDCTLCTRTLHPALRLLGHTGVQDLEEGVHGRWRGECTADRGGSARRIEEGVHGGSITVTIRTGEPKTLTKSIED